MTKKNGKISVSLFEKVAKELISNEEVISWNGLEITIKKTISFEQMLIFTDAVVKSCFDEENGEYMPEIKEFAIKCALIDDYTNITLPEGVDRKYNLLYKTDIVNTVLGAINYGQYMEIVGAIDKKIDNIIRGNIEGTNKQATILLSEVEKLQEQIADVLQGLNSKDVALLASKLHSEEFDADNVVKAYIDASKNVSDGDE